MERQALDYQSCTTTRLKPATKLLRHALLLLPAMLLLVFRKLCFELPWIITDCLERPTDARDRYDHISWWWSRFFDLYFGCLFVFAGILFLYTLAMMVPKLHRKMKSYASLWWLCLLISWVILAAQISKPAFFG